MKKQGFALKQAIQLIKISRRILYQTIHFFLLPILKSIYAKRIKVIPKEKKILFLSRLDFGTFLIHLHYAGNQPNICIVILTPHFHFVESLANDLSSHAQIISVPFSRFITFLSSIFGIVNVQSITFAKIFNALYKEEYLAIYYPHLSPHIPKEKELKKKDLSEDFYKSYQICLKNYQIDRSQSAFHHYGNCKKLEIDFFPKKLQELQMRWGFKTPYVVININCKKYRYHAKNIEQVANIRRIFYPERYNVLIDHLIEKGYSVLLQGREEQPNFVKRKGFYDLSNKLFTSEDTVIYSGASFCITCKTGPEVYANIFDLPVLGLNYTELFSLIPFNKFRFFPKHILDPIKKRLLSWKEWIKHPVYYNPEGFFYEYQELSEEELISAVEEFLQIDDWSFFSKEQENFRKHILPYHFDLFQSKGTLCDCYLNLPYHNSLQNIS